jgi:starvation-inducible outer membrane lipoprotein
MKGRSKTKPLAAESIQTSYSDFNPTFLLVKRGMCGIFKQLNNNHKKMKTIILSITFLALLASCDSKPKVIESVDVTAEAQQQPAEDPAATQLHKVVVEEVLPTSKYTYLNVSEDGVMTWIAIPKKEVKKGGTYYYRGGLKKTNFKSVEYDRVFETLYLVSDVSEDPGMSGMAAGASPHGNTAPDAPIEQTTKIDPVPGGITIAELLENRKKYEGQTVRIKGRCVKLNNMIMNRNWIHLQDGSLKDKTIDLTVTTTENIPLGAIVALEGKIALNKDFGAGYKYDIIMEEAKLIP